MNTPAHLIFAAAVYAKPERTAVTVAALLGAFMPDASLYFLVAWAQFVQDIPPRVIFSQLYFSPAWQQIFAIDNSVFVWGSIMAVGLALRKPVIKAFAGAGLLHIGLDFLLHHDDGRPHFWPLSNWIFESPVSYWDPRAHGRVIGLIEVALCAVFLGVLWRRYSPRKLPRIIIVLAAAGTVLPGVMFAMMFGS